MKLVRRDIDALTNALKARWQERKDEEKDYRRCYEEYAHDAMAEWQSGFISAVGAFGAVLESSCSNFDLKRFMQEVQSRVQTPVPPA